MQQINDDKIFLLLHNINRGVYALFVDQKTYYVQHQLKLLRVYHRQNRIIMLLFNRMYENLSFTR